MDPTDSERDGELIDEQRLDESVGGGRGEADVDSLNDDPPLYVAPDLGYEGPVNV